MSRRTVDGCVDWNPEWLTVKLDVSGDDYGTDCRCSASLATTVEPAAKFADATIDISIPRFPSGTTTCRIAQ